MPTRNRLDDVKTCLPTLRAQQIQGVNWEVIIVDNGSTDGTAQWAKERVGGSNPRVRYVYEPNPGLLSGRHRGAAEARGDLLTFIDDDIQAASGWLGAILGAFSNSRVALAGGPCLPNYEFEPPQWIEEFWTATPYGGRACGYLSLIDIGDRQLEIDPAYIYGLNFSIRKQALQELGGFHPDGVPADLLRYRGDGESGLAMAAVRHGLNSVYVPGARVQHKVPADRMTLDYFERRAYAQGVSDSYTRTRRQHGLYGPMPQRSIMRGIKRRLGRAGRLLASRFVGKSGNTESSVPARAPSERRLMVQAAYERGFAFHQAAMQNDPSVREWVLRADYWDYALPAPEFVREY
jgi:glycosyltransferase involved in cell wall biosynthesis